MSVWVVLSVVACGGAATVIRYLVSRAWPVRHVWGGRGRLAGGVLVVNVVGSALGGVVLGLAERAAISADLQLVLLTGVCGGLTTFSTWSVETIELVSRGRWRSALLNAGLTLALGAGVCTLGYLLTR
ncbi:CrcB family protein [Cryobacterium melibiosiphilum]|uniref:Fluoride-specific ion channel FluC n=1 Tax=Cryobacterium melibiosiphilum TaxID=995039 RepID=A0A3A5MFX6_9MICO|nr:CrcB family protein [Cryobacterium melibiosiphilum]RJT89080.1 CrcB family protein [Cryobacterium melibiosiphilum]